MKNIFYLFFLLVSINFSLAKKVKFEVDMSGQTLSPNGIHVAGDFQTAAGYAGGDWNSETILMKKNVNDTDLYSVIVDLPAFRKYEYKFVNGDKFYEVEFIPEESRVGFNFGDNRWIYVDSLLDDTTTTDAIIFATNAPKGKKLLRLFVDMRFANADTILGVHVAGTFQNNNPATTRLYSFSDSVYEIILHIDSANYLYKFYNGNKNLNEEIIPALCSVNSKREVNVFRDTVLEKICFSSCVACVNTGINSSTEDKKGFTLYPNPGKGFTTIRFENKNYIYTVSIFDVTGKLLKTFEKQDNENIYIADLSSGIYIISGADNSGNIFTSKFSAE